MPVALVSRVPIPLNLLLIASCSPGVQSCCVTPSVRRSAEVELTVGDVSGQVGVALFDDCLKGPVFLPKHFIWKSTT